MSPVKQLQVWSCYYFVSSVCIVFFENTFAGIQPCNKAFYGGSEKSRGLVFHVSNTAKWFPIYQGDVQSTGLVNSYTAKTGVVYIKQSRQYLLVGIALDRAAIICKICKMIVVYRVWPCVQICRLKFKVHIMYVLRLIERYDIHERHVTHHGNVTRV